MICPWAHSLCNLAVQIIAGVVLFSFLWFKIPSRLSRLKEIFKSLDKIFVTQHFIVLKSQGVAEGGKGGGERYVELVKSVSGLTWHIPRIVESIAGSGQYIIIWVSVAP